jgi:predicted AlkP superfamily pyrophosphatase or phosphodiesterase
LQVSIPSNVKVNWQNVNKLFVLIGLLVLLVASPVKASNPVVLLSFDGFAQQYITQYQPKNILALMQQGIAAKGLIPVYPSKTFPNHLAIVTGSYSAKHGIIYNNFFHRELKQQYVKGAAEHDPSWLSAKPIWTLAQQHGLKAALYFWPEAKVNYQGVMPSYVFSYNKHTSNEARIEQIIHWLNLPIEQRPDFIAGYFSLVDSAGHVFGPNSSAVEQAVQQADVLVGRLVSALRHEISQPVELILVSDHGMMEITREQTINWRELVPLDADIRVFNGQSQVLIYCADDNKRAWLYQLLAKQPDPRFTLYQKHHFPSHWHWQNNDHVLPDLVLEANMPFVFTSIGDDLSRATHGFDPLNNQAMHGIFIAAGPSFKQNVDVPAFENIHIFPLLTKLLGLPNPENIDGNSKVLAPYLKEQP